MGSYQEFDQLLRLMQTGVAVQVDDVLGLPDYLAALHRLETGEQLGKIVLQHGAPPAGLSEPGVRTEIA